MTTTRIICLVAFIILGPLLGGLLEGFDRKISARMQGRVGPSILQPFYDMSKLFKKRLIVVRWPQILLVVSYLIFIILTGVLFFGGFDMLLCFFTLTTAAMFLVLAASVTYSPYSSLGSAREMIQMMSYEPMVLLTAVGFFVATGSFETSKIATSAISPIAYLPGVFLGFAFIMTIKLRKSPFDISTSHHAHQEMVKGVTTEMSGPLLGMANLAEWYEIVLLMGITALFIINENPISWIVAVVVCAVMYFIEILIDNTSARLRWDKVISITWVVTLVLGCLNILILMFR